ncbi:MAG: hypothetical protein WBB45_14460 [Cyclobacteriaceae bacterium]
MRNLCFIISTFLYAFILTSCDFSIFPDESEIVVYEGYVLDYSSRLPIDSVEVVACTRRFSLFPGGRNCDYRILTDSDGYFYLRLSVEGNESSELDYYKLTYTEFDECEKQADGTYECYLIPNPTKLVIEHTRINTPLTYDSLVLDIDAINIDTTFYFNTQKTFYPAIDTVYYWSRPPFEEFPTSTSLRVSGNSNVILAARYFKSNTQVLTEYDTLFFKPRQSIYYEISR